MTNQPVPNKFVVIILLTLLLGGLTWLVLHFWPESQESGSQPQKSHVGKPLEHPQQAPTDAEQKALAAAKKEARWKKWREQEAQDPSFEWKTPIAFYGLVLDTEDKAVEGAVAYFQWTDLSAKGTSNREILSDANGRFELTGVQGKRMVAEVLKDGYYPVTKGTKTSFEYAAFFEPNYHEPDPAKPVIYRMRKATPPEQLPQLLLRSKRMDMPPDGSPLCIDVRAMQASDEKHADLVIRMKTEPPPEPLGRYPWSASIEAVNGTTLLESDEEFLFEAPLDGYQTTYAYNVPYKMDDRGWSGELIKHYYVKGKNGKFYAHLQIEYDPQQAEPGDVTIGFYVNASGSRDLECPTDRSRLPR